MIFLMLFASWLLLARRKNLGSVDQIDVNMVIQICEHQDGFEALYGHPCGHRQLYQGELGEKHISGPDLVRESKCNINTIKKRLLMAQSRKKSYVDRHEEWDHVFLKVSPTKGNKVRIEGNAQFLVHWTLPDHITYWRYDIQIDTNTSTGKGAQCIPYVNAIKIHE